MTDSAFAHALADAANRIEAALDRLLPAITPARPESRVAEAMRYAVMGGGKRLRGFLAIETARLFDVRTDSADALAAAIECLHGYSLVHDDLPCMDDDDLRRGKPTVHRAYDEATAVLVGDALQARAFEILADPDTHQDPFVRCELVRRLAQAAGADGMVGGQMIDILAETAERPLTLGEITRLQRLKTGVIIAFSCAGGAVMGHADPAALRAIDGFAHDLGLAFQIHDDVLDVTGDSATTGKRVGKDTEAGKATFVTLLGLEAAQNQAKLLVEQAESHLQCFGARASLLRDCARFVISRRM